MKKAIVASILGLALSAADSQSAGYIIFYTYLSSSNLTVVYAYGSHAGQPVPGSDGYSAELFYGLGAGLSESQLTPIPSSLTPVGVREAGLIFGYTVTLPGWTSGPVTFGIEIVGAGGSVALDPYTTWTEPASSIAGDPLIPTYFTPSILQAAFSGASPIGPPIALIYVVPEPGFAVFVGLGLIASAQLRRRRF
jgi:hypothetical protein